MGNRECLRKGFLMGRNKNGRKIRTLGREIRGGGKKPIKQGYIQEGKWLPLFDIIPTIIIKINTNYEIMEFSRLLRGRTTLESIGQNMFKFIAEGYRDQARTVSEEGRSTGPVGSNRA